MPLGRTLLAVVVLLPGLTPAAAAPAAAETLGTRPSVVALAPSGYDHPSPTDVAVAPDPLRDQQVVAFVHGHRPYLARTTAEGAAAGPSVALAADLRFDVHDVDVAWDPARDAGVAVFRDENRAYAQRVDAGLQPVGPRIEIVEYDPRQVTLEPTAVPVAAGWLLLWRSGPHGPDTRAGLSARVLDLQSGLGPVRTTTTFADGETRWAIGDGGPGRRVLAWSGVDAAAGDRRRVLRVQRLGDDGALLGEPRRLTDQGPDQGYGAGVRDVAVGWDGERWAVGWRDFGRWEYSLPSVVVGRLSADLTPLGPPTVLEPPVDPGYYDGGRLELAVNSDRDEALAVWSHGDGPALLAARAVNTATGAPIDTRAASIQVPETERSAALAGPFAVSPAGDGAFTALWRINHWNGLEDGGKLLGRALAVGRAPETVLTAAPSDGVRAPAVTVTFTAQRGARTAPDAPVAFACRGGALDVPVHTWDDPWSACTSPHTLGQRSLAPHELVVRAGAGGWLDATPATRAWRSGDFEVQDAEVLWRVPGLTTARVARFGFRAFDPSGLVRFECSYDGAAPTPCASAFELTDVPLGRHELRVWAIDPVGNVQRSPTVLSWTVFSIEEEQEEQDERKAAEAPSAPSASPPPAPPPPPAGPSPAPPAPRTAPAADAPRRTATAPAKRAGKAKARVKRVCAKRRTGTRRAPARCTARKPGKPATTKGGAR